jgi:hypothetical protein
MYFKNNKSVPLQSTVTKIAFDYKIGGNNIEMKNPFHRNFALFSLLVVAMGLLLSFTSLKKTIFALFSLFSIAGYGQITYSSIPMDSALVARNLSNNKGTLNIVGQVNSAATLYDSICLKVYRNYLPFDSVYKPLAYSSNAAPSSFSYQIQAELKEYAIKIYGIKNGVQTLDTAIRGLVAGDVFVIEGQSNAFAFSHDNTTANYNKSEYIRVFGNSDSSTAGLLANLKWFMGEGDGYFLENGHAGQWGLRLARLLKDTLQIPTALFNGACVATPIRYYMRPSDYRTNINSNYGRLYYRLTRSGLQNNVRFLAWSQGEADAVWGTNTPTYVADFDTLHGDWLQDFPSIQKTYIFQTRNGGMPTYPFIGLQLIKEAQREIVMKDTGVEIMSTSALGQDSGDLHFDFVGGYEEFGNRLYNLIARDLYGIPATKEINAPLIKSAYLSDSTTLVVVENADSLLRHDNGRPINCFEIENALGGTNIDTIYLNKNQIIFKLSQYPGNAMTVSFLAQPADSGNWVTNTNKIEIVCFYEYPVNDSVINSTKGIMFNSGLFLIYPNPSTGKFTLFCKDPAALKTPYLIEIYNVLGEKLCANSINSFKQEIDLSSNPYGYYMYRIKNASGGIVCSGKLIIE